MLAPAVEPPAVLPDCPDHRGDAPIAAGQQPFDNGRLAVVVPVADRRPVAAVGAQRRPERPQPGVDGLVIALRGPLERGVRLGYETADRDRAPDVATVRRRATR